jgi:tetratricopeptide (TPR) repeat protein
MIRSRLIAALVSLSACVCPARNAEAQAHAQARVHAQAAGPSPSASSELENGSPQARADALFLQGKAAAQAKNWNEAHNLLAQAWQLKQSYDIASNLGQVAYLLGKHAEAAQHVAFALRHYPATGDAEQKQKTQDLLDMVRQKVSSLSVQVTPLEAEVLIDGASAGHASELPPELFVEPGERVITARLGGEAVEREVSAKAGGHYNLELVLANTTPAAAAAGLQSSESNSASNTPADPADASSSQSGLENKHIALIVGGALTVGSGVALGIYASKRSKAESDIETYQARVEDESSDPNACASSNSDACQDLARASDDWETSGQMRNIFLATTMVLAAGTVATFFLWPSPADEQATTSLTPILTEEHQGLLFSGTF